MWHQIVERSCVNHHILSIEGESEAIQAPWSRAVQEFTAHVIVRTVTGTFEAHAVVAERYSTTQVNTALIQPDPVRAIAIFDNCLSSLSPSTMQNFILLRCDRRRLYTHGYPSPSSVCGGSSLL